MADEVLSQAEIEALMGGGGAETPAPETAAEPEEAVAAEAETAVEATPPAETFVAETPSMDPVPSAAPDIRMSVQPPADVRPVEFAPLTQSGNEMRNGVDLIMDVQLHVAVELGRAKLNVRDILGLGPGAVVELDKHAGEPVEIVVNGKLLARGEVVLIDENFGVRVTEIVSKNERDTNAKAA